MLLKGTTAIVTGGTQGIGRGIAELFSREGSSVVICSRSRDRVEMAASEILRETGNPVIGLAADVSKKSDVEAVVDATVSRFEKIDILVNNAGIQEFLPFLDVDEDFWQRHFDINVKGMFLFCQAVCRVMMNRGGCKIINMSSDSGRAPVPTNGSVYCMTKSAIIGLTRVIAKDMGPHGIYCNAICPGGIDETGMQERYYRTHPGSQQADIELTALKRLGKPADVARAALFLASHLSDHVTGEHILVTGGDIMSQ